MKDGSEGKDEYSDDLKRQMNHEVKELVQERSNYIDLNYPDVRKSYVTQYGWLELDPVRHEICIALTFGLHQAAMTLTNHLMESVLKYGLITRVYFDLPEPTEEEIKQRVISSMDERFAPLFKKYGNKNLKMSIDKACEMELIDEEQKDRLHIYRDKYRNAFSHSDKAKTFGNDTIPMQAFRFDDKEGFVSGEKAAPSLATFLMGQGLFQAYMAEREAIPYFLDIDFIVRQIRFKLFGEPKEVKL